jgi:hypothetical protein
MSREQRNIGCSAKEQEDSSNPVFRAVLIYENFAAGVRARRFFERLARAWNKPLEEQMWNFAVLGIRETRNAAASAARKADVVAVSVSGQMELPGVIRAWLDMWLWLLEDEKPALLALFDSASTPNVTPIGAHLSCVARSVGIDFFLAYRQVSLSPVVGIAGPHQDAIWPKSAEQDLLSWLRAKDGATLNAERARQQTGHEPVGLPKRPGNRRITHASPVYYRTRQE